MGGRGTRSDGRRRKRDGPPLPLKDGILLRRKRNEPGYLSIERGGPGVDDLYIAVHEEDGNIESFLLPASLEPAFLDPASPDPPSLDPPALERLKSIRRLKCDGYVIFTFTAIIYPAVWLHLDKETSRVVPGGGELLDDLLRAFGACFCKCKTPAGGWVAYEDDHPNTLDDSEFQQEMREYPDPKQPRRLEYDPCKRPSVIADHFLSCAGHEELEELVDFLHVFRKFMSARAKGTRRKVSKAPQRKTRSCKPKGEPTEDHSIDIHPHCLPAERLTSQPADHEKVPYPSDDDVDMDEPQDKHSRSILPPPGESASAGPSSFAGSQSMSASAVSPSTASTALESAPRPLDLFDIIHKHETVEGDMELDEKCLFPYTERSKDLEEHKKDDYSSIDPKPLVPVPSLLDHAELGLAYTRLLMRMQQLDPAAAEEHRTLPEGTPCYPAAGLPTLPAP